MDITKRRYYRPNHLFHLDDLPMHRKMLHMILWERADCLGWVKLNWHIFAEIGKYSFTMDDIKALDRHVVVLPNNQTEAFLPDFLKVQQNTLSRGSKGNAHIWRAMEQRYGITKDNMLPYWNFMKSIKRWPDRIEVPEEYHEGGPKPRWYEGVMTALEAAKEVHINDKWPESIRVAFVGYKQVMEDQCASIKSFQDKRFYEWTVKKVDTNLRRVQDMINRNIPEHEIIQQIDYAATNNLRLISNPPEYYPKIRGRGR